MKGDQNSHRSAYWNFAYDLACWRRNGIFIYTHFGTGHTYWHMSRRCVNTSVVEGTLFLYLVGVQGIFIGKYPGFW